MRLRSVLILGLALLFGLGAAVLANQWMKLQIVPVAASSEPETAPVVVAAQNLPMGKRIDNAWIKVVNWPIDSVPENSYSKSEEVAGQVVREHIYSGEVVLANRLSKHEVGSAMSSVIKISKRAVTVRVNDVIGVAGFILPGNYVDVLATRIAKKRAKTRIILQNMKVLAVDQKATTNKDEPVVVRAVTLEATPKEAERLIKSESEGSIQLALRNTLDNKPIAIEEEPVKQPQPVVVNPEPRVIVKTKTVYVQPKATPVRKKQVAVWKGSEKEVLKKNVTVPNG